MFKNSLILIPMKIIYTFLILVLCSCATGPKVVKPIRLDTYDNFQQADTVIGEVEHDLKKKKWNR